jgi:hypothetical protein
MKYDKRQRILKRLLAICRIPLDNARDNHRRRAMFRQIMQSIAAALSRGFSLTGGLLKGFVLLPFCLFGGGGGTSISRVDTAAIRERMAAPVSTPTDTQKSLLRDASIGWSHVNGSLGDRNMRPMPPALSRKMQLWLVGLDHRQLVALKNAGPLGVFEHAAGRKLIAGVHPVGPLKPVSVCFPPLPATVNEDETPRLVRRFA